MRSRSSFVPLNAQLILWTAPTVFMLDQWTKFMAEKQGLVILNPGISFGLAGAAGQLLITFLLLIILIAALYSFRTTWIALPRLAGLFVGGAVSNIMDRLIYGGVRDWLWLPVMGVHNNLADYAVVFALLAISILQLGSVRISRHD